MGIFRRRPRRSQETTEGGAPVFVHTEPVDHAEVAARDPHREVLRERHLTGILGDDYVVLQEIISRGLTLDVFVFPPNDSFPCYTLVTNGMSDLPMTTPPGVDAAYLELLIALPPGWPGLDPRDSAGTAAESPLADERNYWPVRLLKDLARLPHDYDSWLSWGHSIPNGDPAEPYAQGVPFTGAIVGPPLGYPVELMNVETPGAHVSYLAVLPVTDAEMAMKIADPAGADPLIDLLQERGVTAIIDTSRESVA